MVECEWLFFRTCSWWYEYELFAFDDSTERALSRFSDIIEYDIKRTDQQYHNTDNLHRNHYTSENQER